MLRDRIRETYLEQDNNCAEAILHAANQEYGMNISPESFKLVGGFGGGMACGKSCGALCGGIAAIGQLCIQTHAHASPNLKEHCAKFVHRFEETLGSDLCVELMAKYKKEDTRCLETVLLAADVLEEIIQEIDQESDTVKA